jgi:endonuclease/exonuclease/phosphatase family metal-dependent hydrolase
VVPTAARAPASAPVAATADFLKRQRPGDLRVVSLNVLRDSVFPEAEGTTLARFKRMITALQPDVLALQEIESHSAEEVAALLNTQVPLSDGGAWHAYRGQWNVIASRFPLSQTADKTEPPAYAQDDGAAGGGQGGGRQARVALALIDLPDDRFPHDLYVANIHFKCCGDDPNGPEDQMRRREADALVHWLQDAETPGGAIDLPKNTGIVILGDMNLVGSRVPLETLLTGKIVNASDFGAGGPPDWDQTSLTDADPRHNGVGPDDYTWRNDTGRYAPGRLDYILYSDSVLQAAHKFVLNTLTMSPAALAAAGLEKLDVANDDTGANLDHLPVVVDFRMAPASE